mgnify:CR=1 FL=1
MCIRDRSSTGGGGGGSSLTLQVDGVTQAATTLNFLQNNALLSGGVLNISRLTHYDKIPLIYSTSATIKDLKQDVNGDLSWGTDILATEAQLATKQDVLPGLSLAPPTYIASPAHWHSATYAYSWVNQTTHSVFTSKGATGYDMYQNFTMTAGTTYTLKADVKLVGSSSVFVMGISQGGTYYSAQTFTSADGLNTSTYTTLSLSFTATGTSGYWYLGYIDWHTGTQPSNGDVYHLQNVSVEEGGGGGVSVLGVSVLVSFLGDATGGIGASLSNFSLPLS